MLLRNVYPDFYILQVQKIDPIRLSELGFKGVICDLDNTIIPWNEDVLSEEIINWFKNVQDAGLRLCLLSNSLHGRVSTIAEVLGIDALSAAAKPRKKSFQRAVQKLELDPTEIVVIGDQLFTDIFGGKRIGLKTILVKPLTEKELFWTRFIRRLEKRVLQQMERKGVLPVSEI